MKDIKKLMITLVALIALTTQAWADGIVCTASDLGKVLCTDGSIYENVSAATTAGKTAAAVIAYVDETNKNGLALALTDEGGYTWDNSAPSNKGKTAPEICSALNTSKAVTGGTWKLPSRDEWMQMFSANGGNDSKYNGLNTAIGNAGGTALLENEDYWSSSEEYDDAWLVNLSDGNASWEIYGKHYTRQVRACIAFDIAAAATGPEVTPVTGKTNEWTFKMPGGNVTLEPDYYPQAALATAPTAVNDVPATTDGAILSAGTVANIGETTTAQGTVMYYVSQTALDDAALLALAADQWTADVPTAKSLAQGQAYVYYYVRGNDSDTDAENFSDGDILAANALTVTIAAEPTYAVTFADDTAEPTLWTAEPAADVKKGTAVTVTYSGSKKVLGVKAEKKAKAVPVETITLNKTETSIKVGATETLSVTAVAPDNATDKTYTWKTSDESKATVDQDGKVTAKAAGTVTIYAEANDGSGVKGNCTVTVTPATITVTWNNNDITGEWGESFTKDGVTITVAGFIDFNDKNFMDGGTFTTTLGNFTKIEVTTGYCGASGTGWSGNSKTKTWTGNASSVSFSGDIMGMAMGETKFVFTIEPTN